MKVSIIIPIYNVAPYLANCLSSCINQTYNDLEIICVNDGSPDESPEIIRRFKEIDDRIVQIDKLNAGLPLARRSGLDVATGEYVFHLDGDDSLPPDAISSLVSKAIESKADIVIGDYIFLQNNNKGYIDSEIYKVLSSTEYMNYILDRGLFNIWGKLIKRSLYSMHTIEVPSDIVIAEDLVASFQLAHYANIIVPCHTPCYNYYIRETSMSKNDKADVGILTNRSIRAVSFIANKYKLYDNTELNNAFQVFLSRFLFEYLCSPYPIGLHKGLLRELMKEIDGKYISCLPFKLKRVVLAIARHNLHVAKIIARSTTKLIRRSK